MNSFLINKSDTVSQRSFKRSRNIEPSARIKQAARGKTEAAKHFDAAPVLSSRQNFILIVFAVIGVYQFILNFHIDLLTG